MLSQREGSLTCSLFHDADSYAAFIRISKKISDLEGQLSGKVGELGGANFQTSPVYRVKPSFTELHPISLKFSIISSSPIFFKGSACRSLPLS
ncbi:hypothetical protein OIU85_006320 [Salix viminalis]|uniref:Uncharacterized protein n=1 Tax=Salix viminalis TaxID=40686 RepID=A0A9Q0SUX9_SALVM|nr:hypothetical protein OIU85_006320 [Salix viminalis]